MTKRIVLGSGKLYVVEAVATDSGYNIPADVLIETAENQIGLISGGCTLEYTPEFYSCKDDLGYVSKKMLTNEDAILRSGIMTWDGDVLEKLSSTARVTETSTTRTVKFGGVSNYDGTVYIIRFVHEDSEEGDIRLTIVGSNEAGFECAFAQDAETIVNAEFKAVPHDSEGTLIIYEEEIGTGKTYQAVSKTQEGYSTMNPHNEGWFTRHGTSGSYTYWLTDDELPGDDITYYEYV